MLSWTTPMWLALHLGHDYIATSCTKSVQHPWAGRKPAQPSQYQWPHGHQDLRHLVYKLLRILWSRIPCDYRRIHPREISQSVSMLRTSGLSLWTSYRLTWVVIVWACIMMACAIWDRDALTSASVNPVGLIGMATPSARAWGGFWLPLAVEPPVLRPLVFQVFILWKQQRLMLDTFITPRTQTLGKAR